MKYKLLLLCTFLCGMLSAENITLQQAEKFAAQFFNTHAASRNASSARLQMVWDGETTDSRSSNSPAFYVFNRTDQAGYVIVSGDDIAMPVLGYSFSNTFQTENMPNNIRYWMLGLREEINSARKNKVKVSSRATRAWQSRSADIGETVLKLESAKWDQTDPYNLYSPEVNGIKTVTGCTATAVAIAMHYRQWPDRGTGTIPSYTFNANGTHHTMPSKELGEEYKWDSMPLRLTSESSPEEKHQVAMLMYDCGIMSQAEYDIETGADAEITIQSLIKYMKYSKNAYMAFNHYYNTNTWYEVLRREMNTNGPVFFGCKWMNDSGHAFILDGYTTTDYFSVNWGWGGNSDGYYLLSALNAHESGSAIDMNDYTRHQFACIGMKKRDAQEFAVSQLHLRTYRSDGHYSSGIRPNTFDIRQNVEFTIFVGQIGLVNTNSFTGQVQVSLYSKDDVFKQDILLSPLNIENLANKESRGYDDLRCLITKPIEVGDYLVVRYRQEGSSDWYIAYGVKGVTDKLVIKEADIPYTGTLSLCKDINPTFGIELCEAREFKSNEPFRINLGTITNDSEQNFTGYITLSLFNKNNQWKEDVISEPLTLYGFAMGNTYLFDGIMCTIKGTIDKDDYLMARYRHHNSTEWKIMHGKDGANDRLSLNNDQADEKGLIYMIPGESYNGLSTTNKKFEQYEPFTVKGGLIYTAEGKSFNGLIQICHFDKDGNWKEIISTNGIDISGAGILQGYSNDFNCIINESIQEGDYIALAYKSTTSINWTEAAGENGAVNKIVISTKEDQEEDEKEEVDKENDILASSTQFAYNRTTKILKIKTLQGSSYKLTDSKGKELISGTLTSSGNFSVDTSELPAGTYTITIENETSIMETAIIIGNN